MWNQFGSRRSSPARASAQSNARSPRILSPPRNAPKRAKRSPRMPSTVNRHQSPYLRKYKKRRSTSQMQTIQIRNLITNRIAESSIEVKAQSKTIENHQPVAKTTENIEASALDALENN